MTLNMLAFLVAAGLSGLYLCRLDAINWLSTRASVVVFHLCLFGFCSSVMVYAIDGNAITIEWFGLAAAALWLSISYPTWANGVPAHAQTRPGDFRDTARDWQ
jgi:hypothetical protein